MSTIPEIDVIIPVGGSGRYLSEAIKSVNDQVGVVCRPIVVDARGNKGSEPLGVPPHVRLVKAGKELTAGGARNLGVAHAGNPFVSFLDDDDLWPSERSFHLVQALNDSLDHIAIGTLDILMQPGKSHGLEKPDSGGPALVAGGMLLSRTLFEKIGNFDDSLQAGEFVDWLSRALHMGVSVLNIEQRALVRRVHQESSTVTNPQHRSDYLKVVKRWMSKSV